MQPDTGRTHTLRQPLAGWWTSGPPSTKARRCSLTPPCVPPSHPSSARRVGGGWVGSGWVGGWVGGWCVCVGWWWWWWVGGCVCVGGGGARRRMPPVCCMLRLLLDECGLVASLHRCDRFHRRAPLCHNGCSPGGVRLQSGKGQQRHLLPGALAAARRLRAAGARVRRCCWLVGLLTSAGARGSHSVRDSCPHTHVWWPSHSRRAQKRTRVHAHSRGPAGGSGGMRERPTAALLACARRPTHPPTAATPQVPVPVMIQLGQWERQSKNLTVNADARQAFPGGWAGAGAAPSSARRCPGWFQFGVEPGLQAGRLASGRRPCTAGIDGRLHAEAAGL